MTDKIEIIAKLNDLARSAMGIASQVVVSDGVSCLSAEDLADVRHKIETYNSFMAGNDPGGERNVGSFPQAGETIIWKIGYHNLALDGESDDPADPKVTQRVLTIMLASEY